MEVASRSEIDRKKRAIALSSVAAAVFLTGLKITVGLASGSLGMLSEAAHSGIDLVAALVTVWAVRMASRPADREHTYGHGKFESLSALLEALLLLLTCAWVIYEAYHRLTAKTREVEAGVAAFLVMAVSIAVDRSRSRALARTARQYGSRALEADALHFATDIWSSLVVVLGLLCVVLARDFGLPWLMKADAIAALIVAIIVIFVSVRLGKQSINDLLDAIPSGLQERVEQAAQVEGVVQVTQVRLRRSGPETFADVTLTIPYLANFERTHAIATASERAVQRALPGADVMVHVEPARHHAACWSETVRGLAAQHGLSVHALNIHDEASGPVVELHVEVESVESLASAHDRVSAFEQAVREALPGVVEVVTHIEPVSGRAVSAPAQPETLTRVQAAIEEVCRVDPRCSAPHSLDVQCDGSRLDLSFHCVMQPDTPIVEAHDVAEQVEAALRVRLPSLRRVLIHMEPPE